MEQATREQYTVNGYLFGDLEDVKIAHQELSAIQYMDKKMERYNGDAILSVYSPGTRCLTEYLLPFLTFRTSKKTRTTKAFSDL